MNARMPKSYASLSNSEKKAIYSAVYAEVAKKSAQIAIKIADEISKQRTCAAIECGLYSSLITLHDGFNFGSDASKLHGRISKNQRFTDGYFGNIAEAGNRYDEYMISGLRFQLSQRGIEIEDSIMEAPKFKNLNEFIISFLHICYMISQFHIV